MPNISRNQAKAVYISVAVLGGLAFASGIAGAFTGVKQLQGNGEFKYAPDHSYCTWPTRPAGGLGIAGFFLILAAQITSNANGGCVCCCEKQTPSISSARLVQSFVLYYRGTIHMKLVVYKVSGSTTTTEVGVCDYPDTWPLLVGGVMSLLATGLSLLFFYIVVKNSSSSSEDLNNINGGTTTTTTITGHPAPSDNIVQMPTLSSTASAKNNDAEFTPPTTGYY